MEADRAERRGARAPASAGTKRAEPALAETKRAEPAAASAAPPPPPQPPISSDIFDPSDVELCDEEVVGVPGGDPAAPVDETDDAPAMPAPRTEGTNKVTFGFTPRIFPTPARESKAEEENEWITKNRAHLRKNKALVGRLDALDFGETDPAWLKGKGDEFYRGGDFRSAISAYTSALELDPEMVSCLSNRAACYLRIAELRECVDDCTAALSLRQSEDVPAIDVATEVKLLVRRGTALCQQGSFEASLADYRTANTLDGNNPALASDVERLTSLAQCDTLKKQADARFGAGNISEAVELYASALTLEPAFVSCISNRAACYFALGDMPSAIRDCTGALDLLSMDVSQSIGHMQKDTVPSGPVPPAGSDTRRQWVLKTLVRRGAAHARLSDYDAAIADYDAAFAAYRAFGLADVFAPSLYHPYYLCLGTQCNCALDPPANETGDGHNGVGATIDSLRANTSRIPLP